MIKITKAERFNITGRGMVLALSMSENGMDEIIIGGNVTFEDIVYEVTGVEAMRKLNGYLDNIGLLVREVGYLKTEL